MKTILYLEDDDIVEPTDWCRPLRVVSMGGGMSDSYSFKSCYSGTPENNVKWVRVCDSHGQNWKGKTLGQLNAMYYNNPTIKASALTAYEVVRGDIPVSNRLDMRGFASYRDLW